MHYVVVTTNMITSASQIVIVITKYYKKLPEISLFCIYHCRMNVENPYLKLYCSTVLKDGILCFGCTKLPTFSKIRRNNII